MLLDGIKCSFILKYRKEFGRFFPDFLCFNAFFHVLILGRIEIINIPYLCEANY